MANGPTIAYKGGQRFKDTSPTVFDSPFESVVRTGKRGANWLADLLLGSTPEEEMQTAMESFISPMATAQGVGRRAISKIAGPTRRRLLSPPQEIRAFHGTPAPRFNPTQQSPLGEFNLEKIGTGEGAQTYGQGMYLSAEDKIADWYRRRYSQGVFNAPEGAIEWRLKHFPNQTRQNLLNQPEGLWFGNNPTIDIDEIKTASRGAANEVLTSNPSLLRRSYEDRQSKSVAELDQLRSDHANRAAEYVSRIIEDGIRPEDILKEYDWSADPAYRRLMEAAIEPWKGLTPSKGSLFEVGIRSSPEELIDLGKPLTRQSPQVQSAVRSIFDPLQPKSYEMLTESGLPSGRMGRDVGLPDARYAEGRQHPGSRPRTYDEPRSLFDFPETALDTYRTQLLRDRGIPGAQYLGQSSGARDYVIWDSERLNILRKLAAGVGMVGTGTAAASQAPGTTGQN